MAKKLTAVMLAILLAFSAFSVLGSAVDFDNNGDIIIPSGDPSPEATISIAFADSDGNVLPNAATVAPGSTLKARVSLGTNYYSGGAKIRFYYDTAFFSDSYSSSFTGDSLTLNTANGAVGADKVYSGRVRSAGAGVLDVFTQTNSADQGENLTTFSYDGSSWLFELNLTVLSATDISETEGKLYVDEDDFPTEDNPDGCNDIPYGYENDSINELIDMGWLTVSISHDNENTVTVQNTVTFNANGGSFGENGPETTTVTGMVNNVYSNPLDTVRKGVTDQRTYTFTGWYEDEDCTVQVLAADATEFTMPVEQGVVYYAGWIDNVVISFEDTGDEAVADREVTGGSEWAAADKPVVAKQGYKFMGWEGEGVVNGELPANYPAATSDVYEYTYTATWAKHLTITFNANGGSFSDGNSSPYSGASIYGGAAWDTSVVPKYNVSNYAAAGISRPGYALTGWNDGNGRFTQFPAVYPDDDVTYTAVWQPYNVYIHYIVDPDAASAADIDITTATDTKVTIARYGDTINLASYADQDGTVQNWVNVSQNPAASATPGASTQIVSPFVPLDNNGRPLDVYLVASANEIQDVTEKTATFDPAGGTWTSGHAGVWNVGIAVNADVTAPDTVTRTGYTFDGWSPALGTMGTEDITFTAVWTPNDYSVDFKNNYSADDTSIYESISFSADNEVEFPADPEREGYTFAGWFTDAACTAGNEFESWDDLPATSSSFSVYAKWEVIQYTLTVDFNEGALATGATDPSGDYDFGATFPAMPAVEREGYSPASTAWVFTNTDTGEEIALPATMPAFNVTATAQWSINTYVINFDSNGGSEVAPISAQYNASITAPADPEREGYSFAGWFTDDETFESAYTVPATMPALGPDNGDSITVYAKWNVLQYELTVDLADGSLAAGATDPSGNYDYGADFPAMPAVEKTGYSPAATAWKYYSVIDNVETEISAPSTMPAYDVRAEAQWVINQYTITFDTVGGTAIPAVTDDYGKPVIRPADPTKEGYTFAGWNPAIPETIPAEDVTVTAQWTVNQYTITFDTDGGTEIASITADYGTAVTAPANPTKTGYTFAGWDKDIPATMPAENVTITALWTINQYTITFDTVGGTAIDPITQNYNTDVTAPADPTKEGYTFAGWQPSVPARMPAEDITITAQWTVNQYTITFDTNGGSAVAAITADYGTAITAPADPAKEGYTFAGWFTDNGTFENAYTIPETMPAQNTDLFAKWDINQYELTVVLDGGAFETGVENPAGEYDYNVAFPTMPEPEKEGYTFVGWAYTKTDGGATISAPANMPAYDVTATAQWAINEYTITFDTVGGTAIAPIRQDYGTAVTAPAAPTKEGYTFAGWDPAVPATMPAENITITAQWTVNQYTITFDTDGGTEIAAITQDYNTAVTAPANPTKEGYTFAGWNKEIPATMPAENITITAQWTINQYTITFDTVGGTEIAAITQDYNTAVTAPANPTKEGYTFNGWDKAIPATMPAEDITITAQWTVNQYTITFDTVGGTEIAAITQDYNTAVTAPANPTKEGYTFNGWDKAIPATMPAEDITITAQWTINQYTITFDTVGGTAIDPITQDYNTAVTAPANPTKEGYTFAGWDREIPATMPAENITITAQWTINQYTITFDTVGGTAVAAITQDYNTAVTAPAAPTKEGYTFAGWQPAVPATMPAENITITAQWTVNQYTITFDTDGGTAIAAITQDYNTAVTAPADPTKTGYTFAGWDKAIPATMPAEDITITALWTINQYTITFNTDGGTVIDPITQNYNTDVTAPANPTKEGYTFAGWYYDENLQDTVQWPVSMPAENITLYAKWGINLIYIHFVDDDGETKVREDIQGDYDTDVPNVPDPEREGYTFTGWSPALPEKFPSEDMTVQATWQINQYTITFDTVGGTDVNPITQDYNTAVTAPAAPTKEGYTFAGWQPAVPATMPAEDITLTAQWTVNQYTITFDSNGGSAVNPITQDYNTAVTAPAAPTREGYTFAGWDPAVPATMPAENITLTAQWTVNQYSIKFRYYDDNNEEVVIAVIEQDYGTMVEAPEDPTREGYTFADWSREIPATMPAENLIINALWTVNQYTITFDTVGGTAIAAITQDYGTAVTAPANPTKEGYTFAGWNKEIPTLMPAEDITITAQWNINQYTITFDTVGGTAIDPITQDYNTAVTAPANPTKEGYTFAGWDREIPATMPAEDITITAQWTVNGYSITFNSNGGTAVDTIAKDYGEAITAPADPTKEGYTFAGWFTDNETFENAYTIPETMPAESITVYAKWTVNQYTVSFNTNGGTAVNPITQDYNTVIDPVPESEKTGYEFAGWYLDNNTFEQPFDNVIPADDITVFAKWSIKQYTITFDTVGGTAIDPITQDYNTAVTAPEDPTKDGYDFAGWQPAVPATMPAENITVTAQWTKHVYTVKFLEPDSYNDPVPVFSEPHDDHIFENNIQDVAFGDHAAVPSGNPEINYYDFIGWSTEPDGAPVDLSEWTMPAADSDSFYFYPVFERVSVELALESGSQADIIKTDDQAFNGFIYNAGTKLTVAKLQNQLTVKGNGSLKITASKGPKVCGTGTKIELIDNLTSEVVETYYLIVAGDINGDSVCSANDVSTAFDEAENMTGTWSYQDTVSDVEARRVCAAKAADVNGDGAFDGEDADSMELFVLGGATYSYNTETHLYNVSAN